MSALKQFARIVDDRRNWPTFALAAAFVFAGSLVLNALAAKNGLAMILLIVAGAFAAERMRPFIKGETEAH